MVTVEANQEDVLLGFSYLNTIDEEGNQIERVSLGFLFFAIHWYVE